VLAILGRVPVVHRVGLDVKLGKALDRLSQRLRVPVATLDRRLRDLRRSSKRQAHQRVQREPEAGTGVASETPSATESPVTAPIRPKDLDPIDRELLQIVLNEPGVVGRLISRVTVASIHDAPLRSILRACYDLYAEGQSPTFDRIALRLDDPEVRALAAGLLLPIDAQPVSEWVQPTPLDERLKAILPRLAEREWRKRLSDVSDALKQTNSATDPDEYRALQLEQSRLYSQRPDTKTKNAS